MSKSATIPYGTSMANSPPGRRRKYSRWIVALYKEGWMVWAIEKKTGLSRSDVVEVLVDAGLVSLTRSALLEWSGKR